MFDYEKMADDLVQRFLMQKRAYDPSLGAGDGRMINSRKALEEAPGLLRKWGIGLPTMLIGMGLYAGARKIINNKLREKELAESRRNFFETNPNLRSSPEAEEIHDFVVRSSPDYGKAPRQLGKMVKNILDVDHYITPSVFETKQKKPDGFIDDDALAGFKVLMAE